MVTNTTENKDCSELWVNFTCISSEANPPVYSYLLSDDEDGFNFSESGSWILKISRGGESIYKCTAYQRVGNVTSTNNITLTVNGKWIKCVKLIKSLLPCIAFILFRHHIYTLFYCTNLITFLPRSSNSQF